MDQTHCLRILASIPDTTQYDRLYIRPDGFFALDTSYTYTGSLGRSLMDALVGGHNRTIILSTIEDLLVQLKHMTQHCVLKLDTPYVQGNLRTFELETDETKLYKDLVRQLSESLWRLQVLIRMLKIVYISDTSTSRRLYTCSSEAETIEHTISSLTVFGLVTPCNR